MSAREAVLERALLAMFLDAEEVAVNSYETCTYPGSVFNDRIWHAREGDCFEAAKRARDALGLKAFEYRDARHFGQAGERLAEFRAKERASLEEVVS